MNEANDYLMEETIGKKKLVSTSTIEEELSKESYSLNDSTICSATNKAFAMNNLNFGFSSNNNIQKNEFFLDKASSGLNTKRVHSPHEHLQVFSSTKCSNNDDINVSSLMNISNCTSSFDVQDIKENSSMCVWSNGIEDLCSSELHPIDNPLICDLSNNLNEANLWNVSNFERNPNEHIKDTYKRSKFAGTNLHKDLGNMDIDDENTFDIHYSLESQQLFSEPFDDRISFSFDSSNTCKKHSDERFSQSSNELLELESLFSQKTIGVERSNLDSSLEIHEDKIGSSKLEIKALKDSSLIQQPFYQNHTFVKELPNLPLDVEEEKLMTKTIERDVEIYEEPYDIRPLEDDIPYVVVKPIRVESSTCQFHKDAHLQQDMAQQSMKMYPIQIQANVIESTNGVILNNDIDNGIIAIKENDKMISSTTKIKLKKPILKPLFFPGFLLKNLKPSLENSISTYDNGIHSEENVQSQLNEASEDFVTDRPTTIPTSHGRESEDKTLNSSEKLDSHVISNINHTDEKFECKNESKDLPIHFEKENEISIFMDQSRSNIKHIKQTRNDSCACGSQQKWKKCCGKAIIPKEGLATKQVKV